MSRGIWKYKSGGIPDELFIRGQVPMTKAEVRAVTISKARLTDAQVIWDIGAGTGSISVEAALTSLSGQVHAVEKEEDAVDLLKQNIELFEVENIKVHHGNAPEALKGLPAPDRVFIGGSGGNFEQIINHVYEKLVPGGRVIINAVVLETLSIAVELLKTLNFKDIDLVQVSIAKTIKVGKINMFKGNNPVFVISAEK